MRDAHADLTVVDGLQYSNWDRPIFEEMSRGGIAGIHATIAIWEGTRAALSVIGFWNRMFREHADILMPGRSAEDIVQAKALGKTAIVLGSQNGSIFEDDLDLVQIFHDLGVRVVQLTYNIQNLIGGSCYEPSDSGLTRFGRNVVAEMNRVGMLVDLSHVGERTAFDAIEASRRPVAITHANPSSIFPHPRNKSDDLLRALAANGGVLGLSPYPHLTGKDWSLADWCDMVKRTVELIGIDHVAIGSDSSRKWTDDDLMWIRMGRWTYEPDYGAGTKDHPGWLLWPDWFRTPADFPNLTSGLFAAGFDRTEVQAIVGGNWLRLFGDAFRPESAA
jgi:microsomal dipeptidase-like Zn-dependent dipeptidase